MFTKYISLAAGLLLCLLFLNTATAAQEPNSPGSLAARYEARLAAQDKTIAKLREELTAKTQENQRLRALCQEAGIATEVAVGSETKPNAANGVVYLGKPRTQEWLVVMHKRFADRLVKTGRDYVCVNTQDIKPLKNDAYEIGALVQPGNCTVTQVLGPDEILATQSAPRVPPRIAASQVREPDVIFHVTGVKSNLVDDQAITITPYMISDGTYEYSKGSLTKTVPSFVIPKALTKQEFAEALVAGAKLVEYKVIGGKTEARPIK
jgi:hypothetical protein